MKRVEKKKKNLNSFIETYEAKANIKPGKLKEEIELINVLLNNLTRTDDDDQLARETREHLEECYVHIGWGYS